MQTKRVGTNLFLVDLQTAGFRNLIASYILKGEKSLIVETGPTSSIPNLLAGLKELEVDPKEVAYVALTHVHIDHGGGVGALLRDLPNAKVIVHSKGAPHIRDPSKLWASSQKTLGPIAEMFGEPEPVPEDRIIVATEGETYDLGGENVKVKALETSGHAAHSLSFYELRNRGVFPGDSAGVYLREFDTVFPTTPPPFRPDIALDSLDKLIGINPRFLYYSHFGKATKAVKHLRSYQAQIKLWLSIVEVSLTHGYSDELIRETIFTEDETIRKTVPTLKANPIHRKTLIENSVQGFINYAKNSKF